MKHGFWDEPTVQKNGLSSGERRYAVLAMLKMANQVWLVPFVRRTFNWFGRKWFWRYIRDMLGCITGYCLGKVVVDGRASLPGVPVEWYETFKDVEYRWVVVLKNEYKWALIYFQICSICLNASVNEKVSFFILVDLLLLHLLRAMLLAIT